MSTILFDKIVYGPVHSRRLGNSLGVNLLPYDGKICNFDCIYCECGFNKDFRTNTKLPDRENVYTALKHKLESLNNSGAKVDVITFSGNGEPTSHPQFASIIDDTIELRDKFLPKTKISVLSNGTYLSDENVFNALKKVDNPILKLDSAYDKTAKLINQPNSNSYSITKQVEMYKKFKGDFILQSIFLTGKFNGNIIDNTTEEAVNSWLQLVEELHPREVMIYTIDRETPVKELNKAPLDKLNKIAEKVKKLGIKTIVAG